MLQIEGMSAGYGAVDVVHDVTLDIGAGEVVAVVGANGAGKSTLVKALLGLLPATGTVVLDGRRIDGTPPHTRARRGLAAVLEGRHLFGDLTIEDTLRLAEAHAAKKGTVVTFDRRRVEALFPLVRDRRKVNVGVLSGGQQQMVAIAKALLLQPMLLVLDELSTGLAPKLLEEILEVLATLRSEGMSMLLIEQSVGTAAQVSDRAYVMELGHVVRAGTWGDLLADDSVARAYLGG